MMMPPVAAGLMLASGSLHAAVNAIVKGGQDKMAARALNDASSALMLLPFVFVVPLPVEAWRWLTASALVHGLYLYALIRAYQLGDLSAVYPVLRGTAPLLTATVMLGWFGERIAPLPLIGVALVGGSVVAMAVGRHLTRRALGWAGLTATTIAGYTMLDARGVRAAPSVASYAVWLFVVMGATSTAMFGVASRGAMFAGMARQWRPGMIAGLLSILTSGMALTALSLGPVAPLAALRETGTVTALILAVVTLRERVSATRSVLALGIVGGAALILAG